MTTEQIRHRNGPTRREHYHSCIGTLSKQKQRHLLQTTRNGTCLCRALLILRRILESIQIVYQFASIETIQLQKITTLAAVHSSAECRPKIWQHLLGIRHTGLERALFSQSTPDVWLRHLHVIRFWIARDNHTTEKNTLQQRTNIPIDTKMVRFPKATQQQMVLVAGVATITVASLLLYSFYARRSRPPADCGDAKDKDEPTPRRTNLSTSTTDTTVATEEEDATLNQSIEELDKKGKALFKDKKVRDSFVGLCMYIFI
jgi:hypothetical protein